MLRSLLGLYGVEIEKRLRSNRTTIENIGARQHAWSEINLHDREQIGTKSPNAPSSDTEWFCTS